MHSQKRPLKSYKTDVALKGEITVAPDKSISHRALIFAALAHGKTKISNLLEGEDVLKTAAALRLMGVEIMAHSTAGRGVSTPSETFTPKDQTKTGMNVSDGVGRPIPAQEPGDWIVNGSGVIGLMEPQDVLDMGNSGTAARLLAGLVTPYNFTSFFTGDASLRKRPMKRVFEPIAQFGAKIISRENGLMPFAITGSSNPLPISYEMKMASAQVKSCVLLAALGVRGTTTVIEPEKCRDHTEIMMRYLGLKIDVSAHISSRGNGNKISFTGIQEFDAKDFTVPGDISSAAFFIVAALLVKNSKITIKNVGVNPLRNGIITTLQEMNGNILLTNEREVGGEKIADIVVESSQLKGVSVPASRAASMIDEYPILAIAAANASGITEMNGLEELKVKESNRLLMIAKNLEACGVALQMGDASLVIQGGINQPKLSVKIITNMDHRIAMSFLVMGLQLENGVCVDDASMIATSFPTFEKTFSQFGLSLVEVEGENYEE